MKMGYFNPGLELSSPLLDEEKVYTENVVAAGLSSFPTVSSERTQNTPKHGLVFMLNLPQSLTSIPPSVHLILLVVSLILPDYQSPLLHSRLQPCSRHAPAWFLDAQWREERPPNQPGSLSHPVASGCRGIKGKGFQVHNATLQGLG